MLPATLVARFQVLRTMASSLAFSKFAGAMVQHDGERYEVHRCEPCFFRTLAMLRRERMVNTIIDDEPIESGQQADQWSSQDKSSGAGKRQP